MNKWNDASGKKNWQIEEWIGRTGRVMDNVDAGLREKSLTKSQADEIAYDRNSSGFFCCCDARDAKLSFENPIHSHITRKERQMEFNFIGFFFSSLFFSLFLFFFFSVAFCPCLLPISLAGDVSTIIQNGIIKSSLSLHIPLFKFFLRNSTCIRCQLIKLVSLNPTSKSH